MRRIVSGGLTLALATAAMVLPGAIAPAAALSPDVSFTADDLPTWQTNGVVWALAAAGDKVVAGGTFSQIRPPAGEASSPITVSNLVVLDASTGRPTSCRPDVTTGTGVTVRALATSPDGATVYVGGAFGRVGSTSTTRLAAIDVATCTVKTTFTPPTISSTVRAIVATNDTVYIGGDFQSVGGQERLRFAALDAANGALKPWKADADATGRAVSISAGGSVVLIGGDFFTVNGGNSHSIAAVDAVTGALVRGYPRGFIPDTSITKSIVAGPDAFYVGNEGTGGGVFDGRLALPFSTLDQLWRDNCLGATQAQYVYDDLLYSGHHAHDCSSMGAFGEGRRIHLSAQGLDDAQMRGWFPDTNDGIGESIGPRAMTVAHTASQDYLWVGGEFTTTNSKAQQGLTRFGQTPDVGAPPVPTVSLDSVQPGVVSVRWRTVVDPDDSLLSYQIFRNGSATPLATVQAESKFWVRPQGSFLDTTAVPGQTYSYRVRATDGTNTSALSGAASIVAASASSHPYANAVLQDNPSLFWRLDEASGTVGWDSSTGNRNAVFLGTPGFRSTASATGDPTYAMGFGNGEVQAYSDQVQAGPSVYSVETWFRTTSTEGGKLVGFGNGLPNRQTPPTVQNSGSYDRHLYMTNTGRLVFGVYTGSTVTVTTPGSYNDGTWHHAVATQGPGGMALYVDGRRVGTNGTTTAQQYFGTWRVGGDNLNGWPNRPASNFFAGDIDDTAVYPTVLTNAQVQSHYVASGRTVSGPAAPTDAYGKAVFDLQPEIYWRLGETTGNVAADSGPIGSAGTYFGDVVKGVAGPLTGPGAQAAQFNPTPSGRGGVASDNTYSSPINYSLEAWFSTTTRRGGKLIGFGDQKTQQSNNYDRHVYLQDDGRLVFGVWTGQANTITTAAPFNDGGWHHVVATHSSTDGMKLYVDGVLQGTNPQTGAQGYTGHWKIGGDTTWGSTSAYLSARIDEVAVYGGILTPAMVVQHHALGTGAPVPDSEAPTTPAGLTATLAGTTANLAWSGSTDNVGVTGYEVHRSADPAFVPSAATRIATVTGTTHADEGLAPGAYTYKVLATDAASNASGASSGATVTVVAPDTTAPSEPTGVSANAVGDDVSVAWAPSTDDRGVTAYDVHRSADPGFVPSEATKIGQVTAGTQYADNDLAVGSYTYKVVARDGAGNQSVASAGATVLVSAPPVEPVTVTLAPAEDTWVNQSAPTTVQGTFNQLSARGGTPFQASYLRFALPAAPAGTQLTAASVQVRTTTAASAGSLDPYTFQWATGDWAEATMVYATRPALSGVVVGTWPGGSVPSTTYQVGLSAAEVAARLGTSQTLALTTSGVDNVWLWSKEYATVAHRPVLTLTFEAIP